MASLVHLVISLARSRSRSGILRNTGLTESWITKVLARSRAATFGSSNRSTSP
jgi:hypothetical protein